MAVGIVHVLEPIEIDERDRERPLAARALGKPLADDVGEGRAGQETGERIFVRALAEHLRALEPQPHPREQLL
ncbi:MAG TPA: hypothetical protein VHU80_17945, partial [Polyangiaceae bacterium]|nr:hypothetical protein [Polyangiaceae bacterium]